MLTKTGFTLWMEAAKTASHGKSGRPCIILYMQIRSPRILLRTREKSRSRRRAVSYGTWRILQRKFLNTFYCLAIPAEIVHFFIFFHCFKACGEKEVLPTVSKNWNFMLLVCTVLIKRKRSSIEVSTAPRLRRALW